MSNNEMVERLLAEFALYIGSPKKPKQKAFFIEQVKRISNYK